MGNCANVARKTVSGVASKFIVTGPTCGKPRRITASSFGSIRQKAYRKAGSTPGLTCITGGTYGSIRTNWNIQRCGVKDDLKDDMKEEETNEPLIFRTVTTAKREENIVSMDMRIDAGLSWFNRRTK